MNHQKRIRVRNWSKLILGIAGFEQKRIAFPSSPWCRSGADRIAPCGNMGHSVRIPI